MVPLNSLFYIEKGKSYFKNFKEDEFGYNYITTSGKNCGIKCKVSLNENFKLYDSGIITVAMQGTVLSAFLQIEEFYLQTHVAALIPKVEMTLNQKLFYTYAINFNAYKYNYGRKANSTLEFLLVPALDEIPKWVESLDIPDVSSIPGYFLDEGYDKACWYLDNVDVKVFEDNYSNKLIKSTFDIPLECNKWNYFYLKDIFNISRGKRLKSADRFPGLVPYYSASKENNGMTDMISNPLFVERNALIFTTFGDSYYVEGEFTASDEVTILKNDFLNKYSGLFVSTILNMEKYRYSFGRKAYYEKILKVKISLPSIMLESGEIIPDYMFMENYIKNLNYSQKI